MGTPKSASARANRYSKLASADLQQPTSTAVQAAAAAAAAAAAKKGARARVCAKSASDVLVSGTRVQCAERACSAVGVSGKGGHDAVLVLKTRALPFSVSLVPSLEVEVGGGWRGDWLLVRLAQHGAVEHVGVGGLDRAPVRLEGFDERFA